jgi:hypothetical protein
VERQHRRRRTSLGHRLLEHPADGQHQRLRALLHTVRRSGQ